MSTDTSADYGYALHRMTADAVTEPMLLRFIREYMPRHSNGNGNHEAFEPDGREDIGAEEE